MSTPEITPNVPPPSGPAVTAPARGWSGTGNKSIFDPPEPVNWWRTVKAQGTSVAIHIVLFAILIYGAIRASQVVQQVADEKLQFDVVYLANNPGPGGGGGGSPKPAPPKKVEIPKPPPQQTIAPTPVPTTPPPPTLTAPVMTTPNVILQATGATVGAVELPSGGGGKGTGIGTGDGSGLGPGTGGGFGGGAYRPGNGVENPIRIREEKPQYTPEAMRAKIQGTVELEAIISPSGKVTEVRVIRSLDKVFGLDEKAREAVFKTPFIPCKKQGVAVPCLVVFELQFTLR
jgi:protein TonB